MLSPEEISQLSQKFQDDYSNQRKALPAMVTPAFLDEKFDAIDSYCDQQQAAILELLPVELATEIKLDLIRRVILKRAGV